MIGDRPSKVIIMLFKPLRDWSLSTGRRGYKTGGGRHVKVYPYGKGGGGGNSCFHAEGGRGGTTRFGVVLGGSLNF